MLRLRVETDPSWVQLVEENLVEFLQDHAHNERKVVGAALGLASRYPRHKELVAAMIELAHEELEHFHQVHDLLAARGEDIGFDRPNPYLGPLHKWMRRRDVQEFLLDQLLVNGLVEARGCERFGMLGRGLSDPDLRAYYSELFRCEARHHQLFTGFAEKLFGREALRERIDSLLTLDAGLISTLPLRPALH